MTTQPNLEALTEAYKFFLSLPDEQVYLQDFVVKYNPTSECGTLACGLGHLMIRDPNVQVIKQMDHGNPFVSPFYFESPNEKDFSPWIWAQEKFSLTPDQCYELFDTRNCYTNAYPYLTDKELLVQRMAAFILRERANRELAAAQYQSDKD